VEHVTVLGPARKTEGRAIGGDVTLMVPGRDLRLAEDTLGAVWLRLVGSERRVAGAAPAGVGHDVERACRQRLRRGRQLRQAGRPRCADQLRTRQLKQTLQSGSGWTLVCFEQPAERSIGKDALFPVGDIAHADDAAVFGAREGDVEQPKIF